jgi:PiT family inorganic phosphate transporter
VELVLVVVVVAFALGFDYTNGFHDAANAIATSVSTRALTPRAALIMAAVFNLVGAMLGTEVAQTIGSGIIDITESESTHLGLVMVLSAVIGAIVWNLITWWFGMPSSSSHALIGALTGVGLAAGIQVHWEDRKSTRLNSSHT